MSCGPRSGCRRKAPSGYRRARLAMILHGARVPSIGALVQAEDKPVRLPLRTQFWWEQRRRHLLQAAGWPCGIRFWDDVLARSRPAADRGGPCVCTLQRVVGGDARRVRPGHARRLPWASPREKAGKVHAVRVDARGASLADGCVGRRVPCSRDWRSALFAVVRLLATGAQRKTHHLLAPRCARRKTQRWTAS